MRGNPNEAIAAAFRVPDISAQVLQLLQQMMRDTTELMGASEASLGTVHPGQHLGHYRGAERDRRPA